MSQVTLKPCPFCGGDAIMHSITGEYEPNNGGSFIECFFCKSSSAMVFGEKTSLVERWNARHHTADTSKMVITDAMVEVAEDAYMPFGDMNIALHAAFASQSLGVPVKTLPHLLHELACDADESADADIWSALVDMFALQWQPIETAPLDSGMPHYFLVYTSHQNTLMALGMEGELTYLTFMDGITFDTKCYGNPAHWMPLPIAPIKTHQIDSEKERLAKKIAEDNGMISRSTSP